jgi:hypothetical protein
VRLFSVLAGLALLLTSPAMAQGVLSGVNVNPIFGSSIRRNADGVLAMMGYSVIPGAAASSLQISKAATSNPGLTMGQFGSGFTVADSFPLYLEGYVGYSRYSPGFVFQDSVSRVTARLPVDWNSLAASGGIGWDFKISDHWVLRPVVNVTAGLVASDLTLAGVAVASHFDQRNLVLKFLRRGTLNAAGAGASLVLAYYIKREAYDFDLEVRSTNNYLTSFGNTSQAVRGEATSISTAVWARLRWPTGFTMLRRPVRYVLETQHSLSFGDQAKALGFDRLSRIGGGLETDTGALNLGAAGLYMQRFRITGSYIFGPNVSGWSAGIGVSF